MFREIIELFFHWIFSLYGAIVCFIGLILCIYYFPITRLPLLIYFIIIQVKKPSLKEIDFWTELREKYLTNIPYKKNVYKDTFKIVYNNTSKEDLIEISDNNKGKLLTVHPHGLYCTTHMLSRLVNEIELHDAIINTKVAAHILFFRIPIFREFAQIFGLMPATKKYIKHYLDKGINVCIIPGGVKEMLYSKEGTNNEYIYIKNRKGIFDVLKDEYENIQIYTLGEQNLISYKYSFPEFINKAVSAMFGKTTNLAALHVFRPENIYKWHKIWAGTSNKTITYVGETIRYTGDLEKDREIYIEKLQKLFNNLCKQENIDKKLIVV